MNQLQQKSQSPYKRGADGGLWFGLYLSLLFFMSAYSVSNGICALLSLLMMIAVPAYIYIALRRSYVADNGTTLFSSMWMEGIAIFFFGGLIASFVAIIYMRWIEPDFFDNRIDILIRMYSESGIPAFEDVGEILQAARDQKLLPKPIEITVDMLWLIVFTGSIISMIISWIVPIKKIPGGIRHSHNL